MRIVILISGRGSNMQALIEQAEYYEVSLVISDRPATGLTIATNLGVKAALIDRANYTNKTDHEQALAHLITTEKPDWICLAGYMSILSADFIACFCGRLINIHPSLLPAYKGLNTHERAIDDKASEHGASLHLVTPALDSGTIIAQKKCAVFPTDTPQKLARRVLGIEHKLYPQTLNALANGTLTIDTL